MDTGTILSLAALILTIPLSVIGNIITPHVKTFVALRVSARRAKRIAELTKYIEELDSLEDHEWRMEVLCDLAVQAQTSVQFGICVFFALAFLYPSHPTFVLYAGTVNVVLLQFGGLKTLRRRMKTIHPLREKMRIQAQKQLLQLT